MDARRLLPAACLLALAALVAAPLASAHTSVVSTDGKVRVSIGQLNEPVSTYAVTGLDVCFTLNNTARTPIPGTSIDHLGLSATLRSAGGAELKQDLKAQFGKPGCYTFAEPYVLTEAGQYVVDLSGNVNGTSIDVKAVKAGGVVIDRSEITFPAEGVPSDLDLEARIAALEAQNGQDKGIPAPAAALLMLGLAALAAVRRLR
ncbi:MAG: hypothetical protein ACYC2H_09230 [Thermoplasmatota archaeon]